MQNRANEHRRENKNKLGRQIKISGGGVRLANQNDTSF